MISISETYPGARAASIDLLSPLDVWAIEDSGLIFVIIGNGNDKAVVADSDHVIPISVFILP
jgi:hypothetical protein